MFDDTQLHTKIFFAKSMSYNRILA